MTHPQHRTIAFAAAAIATITAALTAAPARTAEPLAVTVYNPGAKSMFPVASTLITGATEAVLIDAQFQRNDAEAVRGMIKASGKKLTTIYISHGDPDFYFGLDVLTAAYPGAKVVASPATVRHIKATVARKLQVWGPLLGNNAPAKTVVPAVLAGDTLTVDGAALKIIGLDGHDPKHTFVWIPSLRTVVGGVLIFEGQHVWIGDTKSQAARDNWRKSLAVMRALEPRRIVPGHLLGASNENDDGVAFTLAYLDAFEAAASRTETAAGLIAAMQKRYPQFTNLKSLELSARIVKGEMTWP